MLVLNLVGLVVLAVLLLNARADMICVVLCIVSDCKEWDVCKLVGVSGWDWEVIDTLREKEERNWREGSGTVCRPTRELWKWAQGACFQYGCESKVVCLPASNVISDQLCLYIA